MKGRWLEPAVLALLAMVAMALAWSRAWVCDDAFISFRYARNFAEGLGLVYNAGERVEGYSNPTLVWLCALAIRCGLDPVPFAQVCGTLCLGALVPATAWTARRLCGEARFLPLAAAGVALHHHLQDFATCGLETLPFVLLVTLTVGAVGREATGRGFAAASLFAVLAAMTRPDGMVLGALLGLAAVAASIRRRSLGPVLAFGVPGFLLFVPFLAWRWLYYEDLLPNTYYAKSAGDPYAAQGWFYVRLFFDGYWVLWPALVAVVAAFFVRGLRPLGTVALGYLAFVVWVGGDFMFARFCLPVVPLLYVALEAFVRRWVAGRAAWLVVAAAALATVFFHQRQDLLVKGQAVQGVADERAQYPPERVAKIRGTGRRLRELLQGQEFRVAFSGTQAMLVYDAGFAYALEAVTGLTDHFLAHRAIERRGHVGHEKSVDFGRDEDRKYVLDIQRVQLLLFEVETWTKPFPWMRVVIDGTACTLVRWDDAAMAKLLGQPGVECVDLSQLIDRRIAALPTANKAAMAAEFMAFDRVYFHWHPNDPRRQVLADWLAK